MKDRKVIVIGLDGLSFNMLNYVRHNYELKNLNKLMDSGASGPLRSVLPYSSAPNWASITTGVNPGKHGFYSFYFPKDNAYEYQFPNSSHVKVNRVWDIIGRCDKRVLVVNVPGTYPPQQINGYMVTGMLTPDINSTFSYPEELADEIRGRYPQYAFDTNWKDYKQVGHDHLIDALLSSVRTRKELISYMLKKDHFQFAMFVFTETDRLFHSALHLLDKDHPLFDQKTSERNRDKIVEIFRTIDDFIGDVVSGCKDRWNIILLSDHGFAPAYKMVYLNNWLREQGLFSLQDNDSKTSKGVVKDIIKGIFRVCGVSDESRISIQESLLSFLRGKKGFSRIVNVVDSMSRVDWSRTRAYYLQEWGIRINLQGREPQGSVKKDEYESVRNEIIEAIMKFRDPENGKLIFKEAVKRENVYSGEKIESAPDIVLIAEDSPGYEITSDTLTKHIFGPIGWKSGDHSPFGMFSIAGENINNVRLNDISVNDFVPTVLYSLGIPIPDNIDGEVMKEAFTGEFLERNKIISDSSQKQKHIENEEFSNEDEEKVKDRLSGLGYF